MFVDPDGETVWIYYKDGDGKLQYFMYCGQEMNSAHENIFVQQVVDALNYNIINGENENNGGGEASKEAVYNTSVDISIIFGYRPIHDAKGGVFWNPILASETDGAMLSPATILDHELNHAIQYKTKYRKWIDDRSANDTDYTNLEEKRVITGPEQKTAKANGELKRGHNITRKNHRGVYYLTNSPISNKRR